MTTFTDRETVQDALVALFDAYKGAEQPLQQVYNYIPKVTVLGKSHPNLIIVSDGTKLGMKGRDTNPVTFRFVLSTWVIARRESDNFTNAQAETQLNALDKLVRQVIRDNVQVSAKWDNLQITEEFSQVNREIFEGTAFLIETRAVTAFLSNGQV